MYFAPYSLKQKINENINANRSVLLLKIYKFIHTIWSESHHLSLHFLVILPELWYSTGPTYYIQNQKPSAIVWAKSLGALVVIVKVWYPKICYRIIDYKFRNTSCEIALKRMSEYTFHDKSTLVQVKIRCTGHLIKWSLFTTHAIWRYNDNAKTCIIMIRGPLTWINMGWI